MFRRDFLAASAAAGSAPLLYLRDIDEAEAAIRAGATPDDIGPAGDRHAIVIGNSAYRYLDGLPNPSNDARSMALTLQDLAFNVTLLEDVTLEELKETFDRLPSKVRPGEVALVFYAGHGVQFRGVNYILPVEIAISQVEELASKAYSFDNCLANVEQASAGIGIFILDACRDNPFGTLEEALGRGLATVSRAQGETLIAYAAAAGAVAYDGPETSQNSPFTSALVSALEVPGRDIFEVFRDVRGRVRQATDGNQIPWLSTSLERAFVFRPEPEPVQVATAATGTTSADQMSGDRILWQAIQTSRDRNDHQTFIDLYPDSQFSEQARHMLAAIADSGLPTLPQPVEMRTVGLSNEVTRCDMLAAHPFDQNRVTEGILGALVNTREAIRECTKSLAEDKGNPRLQYQLARTLHLREQWDEAEYYYVLASEQNYPIAYTSRASLYQDGVGRPQNLDLMFSLTEQGAELGDLGAENNMGRFYLEGWGAESSLGAAIEYWQRAAAKKFPPSLDSLGTLYSRGRHIEPDYAKAVDYYQRAATVGSSNAMNSLARLYLQGKGVEKDVDKAIKYFNLAIERGNIFAPYHLAKVYRTGWGVDQDINRAIELYEISAERGFSGAWVELGNIYRDGEGVPQDLEEAYRSYYIAKEIAVARSATDPVYEQAQLAVNEINP
ncbi:MAG: caspase family protein, partial [Pseudomonadota bacterium]